MTGARLTFIALIFAYSSPLLAESSTSIKSDSAVVLFRGDNRSDNVYAASAQTTGEYFGEQGQGNLSQIQGSLTFIESSSPSSYGNSEVKSLERRASLGFTQTISQLTSLGISLGFTGSSNNEAKKQTSTWYALRASQWWNKSTILTELEALRTNGEQPSRSYLDTDGHRVLTPDKVTGNRYTLSLTWLATPNAMMLGGLSRITNDNRPQANSVTIEGRYFFNATLTAIHAKVAAYEDLAQVDTNTDFGRVSAREWEGQVHQHLTEQYILAAVLRDHYEVEDPRSEADSNKHRHSRMVQGRFRYRFVTGPVTETVPEVYVFAGQYGSFDKSQKVNHIGLGGSYVL